VSAINLAKIIISLRHIAYKLDCRHSLHTDREADETARLAADND